MSEPEEIPQAFREHFTEHNRQAVLLAIITLAAALVLWTAIYILGYGLILLGASVLHGADAAIPAPFIPVFAGCAILLCLLAWIIRKIKPGHFPVDDKPPFEVFMDVILAVPRVTFEVWGNFSACQFPTECELQAAWDLLQAMGGEGKINIRQLPLHIPKPRLRSRVVFLLQLAGLAGVRTYGDGLWLVLQGQKARRFARPSVKINPELPGQVFE